MGGTPTSEMPLAQLYRKRAIDRENQRYHRQKNKNRLAELEAQVRESREQLLKAEARIAQLVNERDSTNKALDATIQALRAARRQHDPQSATLPPPRSWGTADLTPGHQQPTPSTHRSVSPTPEPGPFTMADEDRSSWSIQGLVPSPFVLHDPIVFPFDVTQDTQPPAIHPTDSEEFAPAREEANRVRARGSVWAHLPKHCAALSPMGRIVLSLIAARDNYHPSDIKTSELTNTHFPSVNSLLNPSFAELDKPVASTIARHLASVVRVTTLPEKLALLYMSSLLVRWQILPSEETYLAIPEHLRPTLAQIVVPHPPDIDNLTWPEARNRMIAHMDHHQAPLYARLSTKSISINWPHGLNDMVEVDSESNYTMKSAFIEHIRNLDNWTTGQEVVDAFPFLKGAVKVGPPPEGA